MTTIKRLINFKSLQFNLPLFHKLNSVSNNGSTVKDWRHITHLSPASNNLENVVRPIIEPNKLSIDEGQIEQGGSYPEAYLPNIICVKVSSDFARLTEALQGVFIVRTSHRLNTCVLNQKSVSFGSLRLLRTFLHT